MIIKNISIFTKKQKSLIILISLIIDLAILSVFAAMIVVGIKGNSDISKDKFYFVVILALLGTIPFGDFLIIISKRKSIAFTFLRAYLSQKNNLLRAGIIINGQQRQFCETVFGSSFDKKLIYVYGKENKGKSTAVLYLLKGLFINSQSISDITWVDSITFVDCTNNRDEILNYFSMDESMLNRIKKFKDNLIVIDNIECLGNIFLDQNIGLFLSRKSCFIIIENTNTDEPMCGLEALNDALCVYSFNRSIYNMNTQRNLCDLISCFDTNTKRVFFSLYFSSLFSDFVLKKSICSILRISNRAFHKCFKKIQATGVFITFPYKSSYCICCKKNELSCIDEIYVSDNEYNSVLKAYIFSNAVDIELKWRCLIRCDITAITHWSQDDRRKMFYGALYNGNYKGLYEELNVAIRISHDKEMIFLFEKAYLAFHVGNHKESTYYYKQLIDSEMNLDKKKELMLRIVESSHGNPNETNMAMVDTIIKDLKQADDFHAYCAMYWSIHIESERGIFLFDEMATVRRQIAAYTDPAIVSLQRSILMRTYTDEIRFHHILGHKNTFKLYKEFSDYLNTCSSKRKEYFNNLYVEANHIHYILLLDAVLNQNEADQDAEGLARTAEFYYDKSLASGYYDEKSKRATRVKRLDLKMMFCDFDYEETLRQINLFRIHSDLNNVGVHVAFCETMLMKALILDPSNLSNDFGIHCSKSKMDEINKHYKASEKIYKEYKNEYGLFRLKFIMGLFNLMLSNRYTEAKCFDYLKGLLNSHTNYEKEQKIIKELLIKKSDNSITKMFLLSIIRAYPIILQ